MIAFEWDEPKSRANLKKHGVSCEEAPSVFFGEYAVQFFDEEHRLITARKATKSERSVYPQGVL
jgi:uncharacterized DUF497 family protein